MLSAYFRQIRSTLKQKVLLLSYASLVATYLHMHAHHHHLSSLAYCA